MQHDLVEERRWVSKRDYVEELALAQLAPGPPLSSRSSAAARCSALVTAWTESELVWLYFLCGAASLTLGLTISLGDESLFSQVKEEDAG